MSAISNGHSPTYESIRGYPLLFYKDSKDEESVFLALLTSSSLYNDIPQ